MVLGTPEHGPYEALIHALLRLLVFFIHALLLWLKWCIL